jgi:cysteine synthase A
LQHLISSLQFNAIFEFVRQYLSLLPAIVDVAVKVPDLLSIAAMNVLRNRTGIVAGPSTGLNFATALHVAANSKR